MGRIPKSSVENRLHLGLHGEPEVPGENGASDQGPRLSARFRHRAGKRRGRQGHDPLYDVAAPTRQKNILLQQTIR